MEQLFENMELDRSLVRALKKADITIPTDIQQKVIPEIRKNKDVIMQSSTGTGKTLAYLLPLFEKLSADKKEMQALILVPTHELAIQVERQIEMLSQNSDIKATSTPVIGNVNILRQIDKLKLKPHVIVGTAGRILELIQKRKISAHTIKTIIIDEADRLLDDNNIDTVKAIIKTTLKERQIVICSATISKSTIDKGGQLMKEPQLITSETDMGVPDKIQHIYFVAEQRDKIDVLRKLVRMINPEKAIAFFANSNDIMVSEEKLQFHKLRAGGIHSSNVKADRKKTMEDFKAGRLQLLIASDIAARGLDIEGVTHIFNVHIPERAMDYLHRAGRTGRGGKAGVSVSIVTEKEIESIKRFERELKIKIEPKSMYKGNIIDYKKAAGNGAGFRNGNAAGKKTRVSELHDGRQKSTRTGRSGQEGYYHSKAEQKDRRQTGKWEGSIKRNNSAGGPGKTTEHNRSTGHGKNSEFSLKKEHGSQQNKSTQANEHGARKQYGKPRQFKRK